MTKDAKGRLAELEEDRAARVREQEAAESRLADYQDKTGSLAVGGMPTDKIAKEIARLRDAAAIEAAAVAVLESAITSGKKAVLEQRRQEVESLARDAAAERDAHRAKLQVIIDSMIELEESGHMTITPTGGRPEPKSLILDRRATHLALQAQRMASGLPEVQYPFDD